MIDSGFPIKIGSTPVDTATTDVNEPLPGNNPRSVGMAISPFVEIRQRHYAQQDTLLLIFHM